MNSVQWREKDNTKKTVFCLSSGKKNLFCDFQSGSLQILLVGRLLHPLK